MSYPTLSPGLMYYWHMSWRMLWRDWRGGELNILLFGLIIAVTSITAVGFFTDRIERGLRAQSSELIAADIAISSPRADVSDHIERARNDDLQVALTASFRSVVIADAGPQLVEVKSVSDGYPLRGAVRISDQPYGKDIAATTIPGKGELWVEPRLLDLIGKNISDEIRLGNSKFIINKVIRYEPDRGGDLFSLAPRVMMNETDLDATGLLGVGARVSYRLLLAGSEANIDLFTLASETFLSPGEKLLTVEQGRPELNQALDSARQFLGLAALISVLLAGVAVATVANRYSRRHLGTSAMYRCLGCAQKTIIRLFLLEMFWLSVIASTIGCLFGSITQLVITGLLDQLVLAKLPAPSLQPLLLGYATGIILLIGFALPPLLSLHRVPPMHVLHKDILPQPASSWLVYSMVTLSMALLLYWQIADIKLVTIVFAGIVGTLLVLAGAAWLLVLIMNRHRTNVGVAMRFGMANIARRPASSVIQIVAFGLGIMVLLLLTTVRTDLINNWQHSLPDDAPNHFVINVQDDQIDPLIASFKKLGISDTKLYPMVRSRLRQINGDEISSEDFESERARRLINREFNLSSSDTLREDNIIQQGEWWTANDFGKPYISVEIGLAEELGINIGDSLGFDINGTITEFKVTSLREVDWDTFNINFFTIVPPGILDKVPASWITSVYIGEKQRQNLGTIIRTFPNVTVIDIVVIMQRVRSIMERVSLAVEFIFMFTLLSGLAVLYAAIQANQDERRFENAVLRTLGASKRTLLLGLFSEFSLLGALSGFLAGLAATSLAWVLAVFVFRFDYSIDIGIGMIGVVSGTVIVLSAGLLGTRRVLSMPPVITLRENRTN